MMSEEKLIDTAFELIGNLLPVADDASASAIELLISDLGIDRKTATRIVGAAFARWMKIYYPE